MSFDSFDPRAGTMQPRQSGNRRRTGRLQVENVTCNLGKVIDLSATGMRVLGRRAPSGEFATRITGLGREVSVFGRVAWTRPAGIFSREFAVEFLRLSGEASKVLTDLAMTSRVRRVI